MIPITQEDVFNRFESKYFFIHLEEERKHIQIYGID